MNKLLLLAVGLATCINAHAVIFTAEKIDDAKKTCRLTGFASPDDRLVSGVVAIPSVITIDNYPYTVTEIKQNALIDMPNVTKISIPQAVTRIGNATSAHPASDLYNFTNCPKLEAFSVSTSNSVFASTSAGLLVAGSNTKTLVRVPQAVAVSNGVLKLPSSITALGVSAFAEVSTVTSLALGPVTSYEGNCGLNTMPWCKEISIYTTGSTLKTYDGVLADAAHGVLISFPPRKMQGSFTLPSEITIIGESAFANTFYLSDIIFSSVTNIRKAAFMGSRIRQLSIPSSVKTISAYALSQCPELTSVTFRGDIEKVPPYMAKGSSKLATVSYNAGMPKSIGNGAFADCTSLTKHPFSNYEMGDSIFANTGFETVKFDNSSTTDNPVAKYAASAVFAGCKSLTSIDITPLVTSPENPFIAGDFFASECPKLTEILFPSYTRFHLSRLVGRTISAVANNPKLSKVILGCFTSSNSDPAFSLSPVKPHIFMKVDGLVGADENAACVQGEFASSDGSEFKPIFYWESPYPSNRYAIPGASYYIPGGAMERFSQATDAGCYVEEFFRLEFLTVNNGLVISLKEVFPEMVKLKKIETDAVSWKTSNYGDYATAIPPQYVKFVKITYDVHGVEYTSTYDQDFIASASSDDIATDDVSDEAPVYYNLQGEKVATPLPGNIYIVRQNGNTTKRLL